ncbi:4-diphosphocytidyl-2-C-methyl-D-erythritol kinase [Sedimentisphaera salicampi]|uniref:4-diphosphocytidyl-2-C-methyl-D-erythritol kinase n=2 Tax=Sedimentisphaera salicampi TaxID=1941349 RepID=A0A1W6LMT1_9BACT|nr:4-(cytidine 5'-diphospho)-2-C-methyl-D-erythritol kinase [Sedimentisphaera salicampi]ARN57061.1 4-diphosphocytidyl-2-C-methyl-D-erythritol kinase [Sedimentisphaera salicampi]OXU14900.1 4-diphosphocytidyl-2-C-methyl-D-erythritol kinase [Sedimentisphaera salicampi]
MQPLPQKEKYEYQGSSLVVNAPAKLNLFLLIAGKRPDGFHKIDTLMTKVSWYDSLCLEEGSSPGIELTCKGEYWAPEDESNLVLKAGKLIFRELGLSEPNLRITLRKNIPAGTGLGSASSDCAAAIDGIDNYFSLNMSHEFRHYIAGQLGSDVPFFLGGPISRCTGKGEKLQKVDLSLSGVMFEIFLPDFTCSTAKVYSFCKHSQKDYEEKLEAVNNALKQGSAEKICKLGVNMLEKPCFEAYPEAEEFAKKQNNGEKLALSGSGCAFYRFFSINKLENHKKNAKIDNYSALGGSRLVSSNSW